MPEIVLNIFKKWKLRIPNIVFSIIEEFNASKNITEESIKLFSESLVSIAQNLGAWIITNGLNIGISREIGKAIEDNSYYSPDSFDSNNFRENENFDNNFANIDEILLIGLTKTPHFVSLNKILCTLSK